MNIPEEHKNRYFYHFTHIDNIKSIVENGGLISTNLKNIKGIQHHNIANKGIQRRRSNMKVPIGPGGVVHDYVPFYFGSKSIMLLSLIYKKLVDQELICFIAIHIEKLKEKNVLFTDASANTDIPPEFFEDPSNLLKLDWNLIDSNSWGNGSESEKHHRMAEALVFERVPLDWIDHYIVYNSIAEEHILELYKNNGYALPNIEHDGYNNKYFYFKKFFFNGREDESLVTGPIFLRERYNELVKRIIGVRQVNGLASYRYKSVSELLRALDNNFCALPETKGIYELPTSNSYNKKLVSEHTKNVVDNISGSSFYSCLTVPEQKLVKLSAYLHDIGKGPKEKWKDGIQQAYPDHPADAIPMLERILSEEIAEMTLVDIKTICLLVIYHDLIGDIIYKDRNIQELINLDLDEKELNMLAALSWSDSISIRECIDFELDEKIQELLNCI